MKAIQVAQFGGPEVLEVADVPQPVAGAGQVLVRIHAVGVNPVETYIRSGSYPRKPALPYTPGTDGAGVIESIGPGVTGVAPGARVYTAGSVSGTYAEYAVCATTDVYLLPDLATFSEGAALGIPYATAYRALFHRGAAKAGETVLIHGGSGGVGTAAIQLAKARGLTVYATAGTEQGLDLVRRLGAGSALNHSNKEYLGELAKRVPNGFNVIIEMLANVNLGSDLKLLSHGGRVVVVGSRGVVEIDPRDAMGRDADVRGMILFNTPAAELREIHDALRELLASKTIAPVIGREYPLAQAAQAHTAVMASGAFGKIILQP